MGVMRREPGKSIGESMGVYPRQPGLLQQWPQEWNHTAGLASTANTVWTPHTGASYTAATSVPNA